MQIARDKKVMELVWVRTIKGVRLPNFDLFWPRGGLWLAQGTDASCEARHNLQEPVISALMRVVVMVRIIGGISIISTIWIRWVITEIDLTKETDNASPFIYPHYIADTTCFTCK